MSVDTGVSVPSNEDSRQRESSAVGSSIADAYDNAASPSVAGDVLVTKAVPARVLQLQGEDSARRSSHTSTASADSGMSGVSGVSALQRARAASGASSAPSALSVHSSDVEAEAQLQREEEAAARDTDDDDDDDEADADAQLARMMDVDGDTVTTGQEGESGAGAGAGAGGGDGHRKKRGVQSLEAGPAADKRKADIALRRALARKKRESEARRARSAEERLIERKARRVRKATNLWGLAAGSSWDTSEDDSDGNRIERVARPSMTRKWRVGLFGCLSVEDSNGIGVTCKALVCPALVVQETAARLDMKFPTLHGAIGCLPPLCLLHGLMMRVKIKARYRIHYGIPLPTDLLGATLCYPCAIVQHRADVMGGFRRRRDLLVDVQPAAPKVSIEDDSRWGVKRYLPGAMNVAQASSLMLPSGADGGDEPPMQVQPM